MTYLKFFIDVFNLLKGLWDSYKVYKDDKWYQESNDTYRAIGEAKTLDEKKAALIKLRDFYNS